MPQRVVAAGRRESCAHGRREIAIGPDGCKGKTGSPPFSAENWER